jgi:F0F1-type ATP synthase gamma subunit
MHNSYYLRNVIRLIVYSEINAINVLEEILRIIDQYVHMLFDKHVNQCQLIYRRCSSCLSNSIVELTMVSTTDTRQEKRSMFLHRA